MNCDRARYNLVNETTFVHRAAAWAHSVCCRRCRSEVAQRKGIERQLARVPAVAPPESLVRAWGAILPERSPRRRRRVLLAAALAPIVLLTAAALWVAAQRIEWLDPTARRLSRLQPAECSLRLRAGPGVAVVDPAPAVARQVARVADGAGTGTTRYLTTGDPERLAVQVRALLGLDIGAEHSG